MKFKKENESLVHTINGTLDFRTFRCIYYALTLVLLFLFYHEMIMFIGVSDRDALRLYLFGIAPSRDLAFVVISVVSLWLLPEVRAYFTFRALYVIIAILFIAAAWGLIRNGYYPAFKIDTRNLVWLVAGLFWGRIMLLSRRFLETLLLFAVAGAFYMVYCFVRDPAWSRLIVGVTESYRITGDGLEQSKSILLTVLSLLLPVLLITGRKLYFFICLFLLAVPFYIVVVVGGYKSALIHVLSILFLTFSIFALRRSFAGVVGFSLLRVLFSATALMSLFTLVVVVIFSGIFANVSTIKDRILYTYQDYGTYGSRIDDAHSLIDSMQTIDVIIGQGFGGYYNSNIGFVSSPHLGFLYFYQKFGILVFLVFMWLIYLYVPLRFLRAYFGFAENIRKRNAILMTGPCVLIWSFNLPFAGLYSSVSMVFLGIAWSLYHEVSNCGLGVFSNQLNHCD